MSNSIEDSVRKLYEALRQKQETDEYVEAVRKKENIAISNWMFSNMKTGQESFLIRLDDGMKYYQNPVTLRVTRIRRKKLIFDLPKLKTVIGKKRYNKIVAKQYSIVNMEGLIEYLKTCGVDPKKFKQFIECRAEANESVLDVCLERGEITEAEIKNCYTVEIGEPYFRLTEIKR